MMQNIKKILLLLALIASLARGENMQIKMIYEGGENIAILDNSAIAKEFYDMLPLSLNFSDYVGKEKVAHLERSLTKGESKPYNPSVGDLFYFAPWGNVGIFYEKQPPFSGLVFLGKIQGQLEPIKSKKQDFIITFSK